MTPEDFLKKLATIEGPTEIRLSPGPLDIKANVADALAAKLILWLYDEMPEDATSGDMLNVLDAARWWAAFWFSLPTEG